MAYGRLVLMFRDHCNNEMRIVTVSTLPGPRLEWPKASRAHE